MTWHNKVYFVLTKKSNVISWSGDPFGNIWKWETWRLMQEASKGQAKKQCVWLLLTCHWPGLSSMALPNWTKGWQMESSHMPWTEKKVGLVNCTHFYHTHFYHKKKTNCFFLLKLPCLLYFLSWKDTRQVNSMDCCHIFYPTSAIDVLKAPLNNNL